ncbi:MAG TPA: pseudouridine synthase [Burkholderiaceae bacterium]
MNLEVLHVDERCLALVKPAGLLAVPGRGADKQDCAAQRVQALYPDALIVHRLDQATSGILLMARGAHWQRELSIAFAERRVHKRYVALLEGHLAASGWQEVALPLLADWPNRPRQKVDLEQGKPSLTRWQVLGHEGAFTRVELEPVTGRSHQLRVHMQSLGHPIAGDALYGHADSAPRLLLHASELALPEMGLALKSAPPF